LERARLLKKRRQSFDKSKLKKKKDTEALVFKRVRKGKKTSEGEIPSDLRKLNKREEENRGGCISSHKLRKSLVRAPVRGKPELPTLPKSRADGYSEHEGKKKKLS